jgi:hypothetical protein
MLLLAEDELDSGVPSAVMGNELSELDYWGCLRLTKWRRVSLVGKRSVQLGRTRARVGGTCREAKH